MLVSATAGTISGSAKATQHDTEVRTSNWSTSWTRHRVQQWRNVHSTIQGTTVWYKMVSHLVFSARR